MVISIRISIIKLYVITMALLIWTTQGVSLVLADTTTSRINPDAAESHALVIGVGNYAHWVRHTQAATNAEKIAQLLEKGGFDVKLLLDPTSADLKKAFEQLTHLTSKKPECRIVIYYCGWGETRTLDNGKQLGWIIPRDCPRVDDDASGFHRSAISTHTLDMYARQMQARHVIMLFDAALNGELFNLSTPTLRPKVQRSLESVRQYIIAGSPGETIHDQNLFADILIQGLQGEADAVWDGYITGSELGVYFFNRISRESKGRQHPQYGKSADATLARGDFIFQKIGLVLQGSLFVNCQPSNAHVKILNIKPRFQQGMLLAPGRYHVETSAEGYTSQRRWIQVKAGQAAKFQSRLQKIEAASVALPQDLQPNPETGDWGLIIGIEQYAHLPQVAYARKDALQVKNYFLKVLRVPEENIIMLIDNHATKERIESYLEYYLPKKVNKNNKIYVYFAGHGAPDLETGSPYLVPYDGDTRFLQKTGYKLRKMYADLDKLNVKQTYLFLDTCFSGMASRTSDMLYNGKRPGLIHVVNPKIKSGKVVAFSASSAGQTSNAYPQNRHGLFTYYLLKALQGEADTNADKSLSINEVYTYVSKEVSKTARRLGREQTPNILPSLDQVKNIELSKVPGSL